MVRGGVYLRLCLWLDLPRRFPGCGFIRRYTSQVNVAARLLPFKKNFRFPPSSQRQG